MNPIPESSQNFIRNELICVEGSREQAFFNSLLEDIQTMSEKAAMEFESIRAQLVETSFDIENEHDEQARELKIMRALANHELLSFSHQTFDSPLTFGLSQVEKYTNELKSFLYLMGDSDHYWTSESFEMYQRQWFRGLRALEKMTRRLKLHACHFNTLLKNKNRNMAPFYEQASKSCSNTEWTLSSSLANFEKNISDCLESWSKQGRSRQKKELINLCQSLDAGQKQCRHHIDWLQMTGADYNTILKKFLKKGLKRSYDLFYKIRTTSTDEASCTEIKRKYQIELPVYLTDELIEELENREMTKTRYLKHISRYWKSKDGFVEVKFIYDQSSSLELTLSLNNQSYFMQTISGAQIFLDNRGRDSDFIMVSAHELGHALGFSDCYVEYYDINTDRLIYYELGRTERNLMCTLAPNASIPESYFQELQKKHCSSL